MNDNKTVLVVGNPGMVYRISAILMALSSEKFAGNLNYCSFRSGTKWQRIIARPFDWSVFIIHLIFSDVVLIAASCHHSIKGRFAIKLRRLLRKIIIVDFYISHYETRVLDRRLYHPDSKEAQAFLRMDREALMAANQVLFLNNAEKHYYCRCLEIDPEQLNTSILPVTNDHQYMPAVLPWHSGKAESPTFAWWGREITNPIHGLDRIIHAFLEGMVSGDLVICLSSKEDETKLRDKYPQLDANTHIKVRTDLNFADGTLPEFLVAHVDYAIGPLGETDKSKVVIANKAIDAITLGIPLLSIISEGMEELLDSEILKACVSIPDILRDAEIPLKKLSNVEGYQEACRQSFIRNFSIKQFGSTVRNVFSNLPELR